MTGAIAYRGRLPGLRCDLAPPTAAGGAIRLDVAAFVGFAERGPLDDPQLVEDAEQYADLFGGDVALALDEHGVPEYAALAPAVGSFFANGGRRAYVVRVAGGAATTLRLPARVIARRPLQDAVAVVGVEPGPAVASLTTLPARAAAPLLGLDAATPGGWALRVAVDVDVVDTVLGLVSADDGTIALTAPSRRLLDADDAVLVWRAGAWLLLWTQRAEEKWSVGTEVPPVDLAPSDGWRPGDVARLLRADVTVRRGGAGTATVVEQFRAVRLGAGREDTGARTPSWSDVLQPATGGFRRDRSMYVRAPIGACLLPVLGDPGLPVVADPLPIDLGTPGTEAVAGSPLQGRYLPRPFTPEALALDGLDVFDPVAMFLDGPLSHRTVAGLRVALEDLGLDDHPHIHGVHAVAVQPEVAIVAIPDLYHRPWGLQDLPPDPLPSPPVVIPEPPRLGFGDCVVTLLTVPEAPMPVALEPRLVLQPPSADQIAAVTAVAAAVADLCAARADMVAVLGLPRHATLDDADHLATVLAARPTAGADPLSYVGLWHPWGALLEPATPALAPLRFVPPDGAVCGTIAAAELGTGVWIEPAGRRLDAYLDVDDLDTTRAVELFDRGLNVLRLTSDGITATSAHSLSVDRRLLQLSVRRLLIWLRLLALREGTRLVFEPDDERFRAQAAALFGRVLDRLRLVGALAAYTVDVAPLASRPASQEGQVRIDLRVAPTSSIEFITVTLLRTGGDVLQAGGL